MLYEVITHGEGLERHENLRAAAPLHLVEDRQVMPQTTQVDDVCRGRCQFENFRDVDTDQSQNLFGATKALKHQDYEFTIQVLVRSSCLCDLVTKNFTAVAVITSYSIHYTKLYESRRAHPEHGQ